jgi:hypothetical protein
MFRSNTKSRHTQRRFGTAHVLALVALFVALGGSAYAAKKIQTKNIASKAVTGSKIAKEAVKKNKLKDEAVTTDKLGEQSVTSSKLAHPSYWAVAGPNALIRSNGATTVQRIAAGNYRVEFETDVSQCSYQVTGLDVNQNRIGHADDDVTNPNRVFVSLRNTANTRADGEYSLAVLC